MKTLLSLFLLLALGASAATGIKISEYPNTPVLTNSELFIVAVTNVTPATNRNISYGQLRSLLASNNFVGSFNGDARNASNVVAAYAPSQIYLWTGTNSPSAADADANNFAAGARIFGDTLVYSDITNLWRYFLTNTFTGFTITATSIGVDSSTAYPLFLYTITPPTYDRTVLISSGWNGAEVSSSLAVWRFFYEVVNYAGNEMAMTIPRHVRYMVCPWMNPYGLNNGRTYGTTNNVAINFNFPQYWATSTQPNKGPSALSTLEARSFYTILTNNLTVAAYIECHDELGTTNPVFTAYVPSGLPRDTSPLLAVISYLSSSGDTFYVYDQLSDPTSFNQAAALGINAVNPELALSTFAPFPYLGTNYMTGALKWYGNLILAYSQSQPLRQSPGIVAPFRHISADSIFLGSSIITNSDYPFRVSPIQNMNLRAMNYNNVMTLSSANDAFDTYGSLGLRGSPILMEVGKVGINTNAPTSQLEVRQDGNAQGQGFRQTLGTNWAEWIVDSGNLWLGLDGNTKLYIQSDGKIGQGVITPTATYHIIDPTGWYADNGSKPIIQLDYATSGQTLARHYLSSSWGYYIDNPHYTPAPLIALGSDLGVGDVKISAGGTDQAITLIPTGTNMVRALGSFSASGAVIATNAFVMPPVSAGPVWCTNGLAAMWNSNNNGQATIYLRTSAVGATTFADKLMAP